MKDYKDVRKEIRKELYDFFHYEFQIQKLGEFDIEYMECVIDHIINIIREQGGKV